MTTTTQLLQGVGLLAVLAVLAVGLLVVLLRLAALPLAGAALVLDHSADQIGRLLVSQTVTTNQGGRR